MSRAAFTNSPDSSASKPVVPMSSGLRAARHAARFAAVASDREKSTATSLCASTEAQVVRDGETERGLMPASSPMSRPMRAARSGSHAAGDADSGTSPAARTSACPIRPLTPMIATPSHVQRCPPEKKLSRLRRILSHAARGAAVALQGFFQLLDDLTLLGAESLTGVSTTTRQNRSPREPPRTGFTPLSRSRKTRPDWVSDRNLEGHFAIERRHLDRAAERRGGETHRHFAAQVLAVALEDRRARARGSRHRDRRAGRRCGRLRPHRSDRMRSPVSTPGGTLTDSVCACAARAPARGRCRRDS